MKDLLRKFKRLTSILKVKRLHLQDLALKLRNLSSERDIVIGELNELQMKYLQGVSEINERRQSSLRMGLELLENHVESIKNEWISLYRKKQELERQIPEVAQQLSFITKQIEVI